MKEPEQIPDGLVIDDFFCGSTDLYHPGRKRGLTVRQMMILIAGSACAIWLIPPAYLIFDLNNGGSYLTTFSLKYLNIARDANLIGRPEADIVPILGSPTEIILRDRQAGEKTYVYAPISYFPLGAVEVQCKEGVVTSIDPWDD